MKEFDHPTMIRLKIENEKLREALWEAYLVLNHAIDMGYLTPGGSTEGMAKDAVRTINKALGSEEK